MTFAATISLGFKDELSFILGMMMYELHLPLVMLANRQLQKGPNTPGINRGEIKDNLKVSEGQKIKIKFEQDETRATTMS